MNSEKITLVLLPGLNGTNGLFKPLLDNRPDNVNVVLIEFPRQTHYSYEQLSLYVVEQINHLEGGFILLGESFSGPLSLLVAKAKPQNLQGVILVATFISAPTLEILRFLPWKYCFRILKFAGVCFRNSKSVMGMACQELQSVASEVLARRIDLIFNVDVRIELQGCHVPVAYFRGKKDMFVPKKNMQQIINIRNDIPIFEFNTDHFLLQRAPLEAWSAISRFRNEWNNSVV